MPLWQYSPVMPGTTLPLLADYLARFGSFEHDPLCPELRAWNTRDFDGLWKRARALDASAAVPYWGIVWPGGRGMARFILDNRKLFRKKRLLDVGTGSGITAAAAALAGAKVTGIDIDPAAIELAAMTTAANHVKCELLVAGVDDLSDSELSSYDIVMAGDIFNNREFADGMLSLVRRGFRSGHPQLPLRFGPVAPPRARHGGPVRHARPGIQGDRGRHGEGCEDFQHDGVSRSFRYRLHATARRFAVPRTRLLHLKKS